MPRPTDGRDDRPQVRLDAGAERVVQRAAGDRHQTVGRCGLAAAPAAAGTVIRGHEVVTLSEPDWAAVQDAVTDPPAPNAALRQAFAAWRASARQSPPPLAGEG